MELLKANRNIQDSVNFDKDFMKQKYYHTYSPSSSYSI